MFSANLYMTLCAIWYHLHKLKTRKIATECYLFQPATLLKVTIHHVCFSRFLICTNGNNSHKASHMIKNV